MRIDPVGNGDMTEQEKRNQIAKAIWEKRRNIRRRELYTMGYIFGFADALKTSIYTLTQVVDVLWGKSNGRLTWDVFSRRQQRQQQAQESEVAV